MAKKLSKQERKRFTRIKRNKGVEAAREYRQGILGTGGTQGGPEKLNPNDINSVIGAQEEANQKATQGSTPNIETTGGSREVTYDENGQPTVKETLSSEQQDLYDQRVGIQSDVNNMFNQYGQQVAGQQPFDPRANNPFAMNQDFSGVQNRVYNDTLARYDRDSESQISTQKDALAQSLADQGIPMGSEKYKQEMNRFESNVANQRENVRSRAFQDSIGASSTAFQNQLAGNSQAFGQNLTSHQLPFQRYQSLMGAAGQYDRPDLGAVQSIQTSPVDYTGISTAYRGQDIQDRQFGQSMDQQMEIARMNNATARSTAGAGRTDPFALLNAQTQSKKDLMAYEQGLNAGAVPERRETGWGDVAGSVAANAVGGLAQGLVR